jgi:hypothetical protein
LTAYKITISVDGPPLRAMPRDQVNRGYVTEAGAYRFPVSAVRKAPEKKPLRSRWLLFDFFEDWKQLAAAMDDTLNSNGILANPKQNDILAHRN